MNIFSNFSSASENLTLQNHACTLLKSKFAESFILQF